MFLTRMALDTQLPATVALLGSRDVCDQAVRSAFPPELQGVLWVTEVREYKTWLMILSPLRPDLTDLHSRYGYSGIFPSWFTVDYDHVLEEARQGSRWRFSLHASPTGAVRTMDTRDQDIAVLALWLDEQAKRNGFSLRLLRETGSEWILSGDRVLLHAQWHGELQVTDEELLHRAMERGLGLGQPQGLGLLLLENAYQAWGF